MGRDGCERQPGRRVLQIRNQIVASSLNNEACERGRLQKQESWSWTKRPRGNRCSSPAGLRLFCSLSL
ncbi:hypothetical protein SRHO_G00068760 [Serrasalmus rhombeus]